jgi:hypothetical protein
VRLCHSDELAGGISSFHIRRRQCDEIPRGWGLHDQWLQY